MRLWGQIFTDGQKISEKLIDIDIHKLFELKQNEDKLIAALSELSHELDLERPVIVKKHLRDLYEFGRAVFLSQDFMESIDFDRFIVEVIADSDN